jgi:hypothetical protein
MSDDKLKRLKRRIDERFEDERALVEEIKKHGEGMRARSLK